LHNVALEQTEEFEVLSDDRPPHLLIYDHRGGDGLRLRCALARAGFHLNPTMVGPGRCPQAVDRADVDIAAIGLGGDVGGLIFAAELGSNAPWTQFVFWVDDSTAPPAVHAAQSLGIGRILGLAQLDDWMAGALMPLVRVARAKRLILEAEASVPESPAWTSSSPTRLALPEAERRFREAYLRRLLSETSNTKRAAQRAGVPYTTLCSMLKKLGISRDDGAPEA
jgi:hypothetical protein